MCNVCLAEVGPKKILDLMNVPWLTRENVASHLQVKKCSHHPRQIYRIYECTLCAESFIYVSVGKKSIFKKSCFCMK